MGSLQVVNIITFIKNHNNLTHIKKENGKTHQHGISSGKIKIHFFFTFTKFKHKNNNKRQGSTTWGLFRLLSFDEESEKLTLHQEETDVSD